MEQSRSFDLFYNTIYYITKRAGKYDNTLFSSFDESILNFLSIYNS